MQLFTWNLISKCWLHWGARCDARRRRKWLKLEWFYPVRPKFQGQKHIKKRFINKRLLLLLFPLKLASMLFIFLLLPKKLCSNSEKTKDLPEPTNGWVSLTTIRYLPFLMVSLPRRGPRTGSRVSSMFSMRTTSPAARALSTSSR